MRKLPTPTYRYETIQFKSQLSSFEGDQVGLSLVNLMTIETKMIFRVSIKHATMMSSEIFEGN